MTKALKEIMKAQGISATRIARTIGRSPRLVSERIRSKNTTLDNLRELLVVLDYRIVIMPNGVRLPDGGYEI